MANNSEASETFHEIPASKYYYLSDSIGAVPKWFFKVYTPIIMIFSSVATAIACLTNWWQILITASFNYIYIQNWMISLPATAIMVLVGYIYYVRRKKQSLKDQHERRRVRAYQDAVISQSNKKGN